MRYKGVYRKSILKPWVASIGFNGKQIHLGAFHTEIEAAQAYDKKAFELYGEHVCLNFARIET